MEAYSCFIIPFIIYYVNVFLKKFIIFHKLCISNKNRLTVANLLLSPQRCNTLKSMYLELGDIYHTEG